MEDMRRKVMPASRIQEVEFCLLAEQRSHHKHLNRVQKAARRQPHGKECGGDMLVVEPARQSLEGKYLGRLEELQDDLEAFAVLDLVLGDTFAEAVPGECGQHLLLDDCLRCELLY